MEMQLEREPESSNCNVGEMEMIGKKVNWKHLTVQCNLRKFSKAVREVLKASSRRPPPRQKTLKIQDVGFMPMGGLVPGAAPAATAPEAAEEDIPKQKERTHFTVRLTEAKPVDKVKLIKEIKNFVQGINLVQAKKLVESLPQEIKANVAKAEAEKIKEALEAVGGTAFWSSRPEDCGQGSRAPSGALPAPREAPRLSGQSGLGAELGTRTTWPTPFWDRCGWTC
ncbi:LOW QUALITY PROTEIN: 54S ribosomal protein L12, mitochondrial-like [Balaenoptera musculus]|uniref:LOW QUALITY PROTEIN: 54S ribosomal protein L12, mitochondrial-like n=1 Tax=Balaenoptera musculus TaxID=9771 RepID=A0A8B8YX64_BALMU|nr:LOW QUALITY PROTEIN: 54S ribosomal protein L12, mitochondrial-like [Balaenoptera musculus]